MASRDKIPCHLVTGLHGLRSSFPFCGHLSSSVHTGRLKPHYKLRHLLSQTAQTSWAKVTCVEAPLGAARPAYGEAAVAQVAELGEGGGGVYGISPGSEGICG